MRVSIQKSNKHLWDQGHCLQNVNFPLKKHELGIFFFFYNVPRWWMSSNRSRMSNEYFINQLLSQGEAPIQASYRAILKKIELGARSI